MPSRKNRGNTQWTAWVTPVIVLACIAVFIVVMLINDFPTMFAGANGDCVPRFLRRFSFQPLRENPLLGPSSSTLEKMGALEWRKVVKGNEMGALCGSMPVSFTLCSMWSSSVSASSSSLDSLDSVGASSRLSSFKTVSLLVPQALSLGSLELCYITNWTIYANKVPIYHVPDLKKQ
ncbi:hypothetical protein Bca52824_000551 [Brassica carinata]|uniref:Uncharacterized protein n=1 Tax=Brassica carinata TaxID=52824 RepID=A0A8X7WFT4_BRACI|nr:hypothetical protein Bca52824_000551 [Brassica carinata]